jgi:hypothetical protein
LRDQRFRKPPLCPAELRDRLDIASEFFGALRFCSVFAPLQKPFSTERGAAVQANVFGKEAWNYAGREPSGAVYYSRHSSTPSFVTCTAQSLFGRSRELPSIFQRIDAPRSTQSRLENKNCGSTGDEAEPPFVVAGNCVAGGPRLCCRFQAVASGAPSVTYCRTERNQRPDFVPVSQFELGAPSIASKIHP